MYLTPHQLRVFKIICNFRSLNGFSPTLQELADVLGRSKITIFQYVQELEKKKFIRREKHMARSIEIIAKGVWPDKKRATKLPFLGNLSAL